MFTPPRCPHAACVAHVDPDHWPGKPFFTRFGFYHARCRSKPVPRFRCRGCRRTFSRQTFRADYWDRKPHLNTRVFELLASGLGLRQTGRLTGLTKRNTELKARKIATHLRHLHLSLHGSFAEGASFQMDELETYETERAIRPLTMPVLIEDDSMFISFVDAAPIRPSGRLSEAQKRAVSRYEARFGRRPNESRVSLGKLFRWLERRTRDLGLMILNSDQKIIYGSMARARFGGRLLHHTTNSKLPRTTYNPLFKINHTEALARDLNGRLRRRSWLVSKRCCYLKLQMFLHVAYRNYVRPRFNRDAQTPGQILGFMPRRLRFEELLTWRQDFGQASIHPLARHSESVAEFRAVRAA